MNLRHKIVKKFLLSDCTILEREEIFKALKLPEDIYNVMYSIYVLDKSIDEIADGVGHSSKHWASITIKRRHRDGLEEIAKSIFKKPT